MEDYLAKDVNPKTTSLISLVALIIFLPLLLIAVKETAVLISRATGTPAKLVVDAQATLGPVTTGFAHAFAQGGEEATDMLAPVLNEVKSLRPRVIRIDHIYDNYGVVGRSGSDLTFDFSRLDKAVDTIIATGAKPVLTLSFMPNVIAKDGVIINPPNNWDEWALVVQKTIEHYSGRSEKNISGVWYEVWNEPDLAQFGSWKLTGEKNYLTLYKYASIGAGNAKNVQGFSLGGPSTTGLYRTWIISLLNSGARVNFLSWHTYQADAKRFEKDQHDLSDWLLPYPGYALVPKLITEFGFTGDKSRLYGTTYSSAHTAAVVRQLISGGPTFAFSFQLKDGPNQQSGEGWGLLTHESNGKKPKPRYYVYNFLDTMEGERVAVSGEGTWVTSFATKKNNVLRVMLVNFDPRGSHTETVPVTITNLEPGEYEYRERFLLGRDVKFKETITETGLTKELYMPTQTVAILELTKLQSAPSAASTPAVENLQPTVTQ